MEETIELHDKHCGVIIFTARRKLLFVCLLCDGKFDQLSYLEHISLAHNIIEVSEFEDIKVFENVLDEKEVVFELPKKDDDENEICIDNLTSLKNEPTELEPCKTEDSAVDTELEDQTLVSDSSEEWIEEKREKGKTHTCEVCKAKFKSRAKLETHLFTHKRTECPSCSEQCFTISKLKIHNKTKHSEGPRHLCPDCGNTYATLKGFKFHMLRHKNDRKFKCDVCGKAFYHMRFLREHMLIHENARSYVCSQCGAGFNRDKTLAQHLKMHANKREYVCKLCGSRFNLSNGLRQHMKGIHNAK